MVFTNPIKVNGLPPFNEGSSLRSRRDSDAVGVQWRKSADHSRHSLGDRENMRLVMWKLNHLRLRKGGETVADGWRWADPKEYDPEKSYEENEVVIVSPSNEASTAGINNGVEPGGGGALVGEDGFGPDLDRATPGWFVCFKNPKILDLTGQPEDDEAPRNYHVHVPVWPPPDGDPDSLNNYWWLMGLYPVTLNICINGIDTPYYVQAQPVPDEFLLGEGGEAMVGEGGGGLIAESP